jgi:hypothetical protein
LNDVTDDVDVDLFIVGDLLPSLIDGINSSKSGSFDIALSVFH